MLSAPSGPGPSPGEERLLRGEARFVDDIPLGDGLIATFYRSPLAHALIRRLDLGPARARPGVVGAYAAADLDLPARLPFALLDPVFARPALARERVRFVGEAMAVVVASSRAAAADALDWVEADLEPLPALVAPEAALDPGAPILFPELGSNRAFETAYGQDQDPLQGAEVVVLGRIQNQRLAPVPIESNAFMAEPDGSGGLLLYASTQSPYQVRDFVADCLDLPESAVRCVAPAVGGAFGGKLQVYPEQAVVAALALRLKARVRWIESRSENLVAMTHGRGQDQRFELAADARGRLLGLRVEILADAGAYPAQGAFLPQITGQMLCGPYLIPRVCFHAVSVVTNTTPTASYRGAGRPEATLLIEQAMDQLARRLGLDPLEIRRRNLIPASAQPHSTASGVTYDSGDYAAALDHLLELADYPRWRAEQARRRAQGDTEELGIGLCCYVEMTALGSLTEYAGATLEPGGRISVRVGTQDSGQGHESAYARIAAQALGLSESMISIHEGDTGALSRGDGSSSSRSIQLGGAAVHAACERLLECCREEAARRLDELVGVVSCVPGGFRAPGGAEVSWAQLALSDPPPAGEADEFFESSFPFGAHMAVVLLDTQTGQVRWLQHYAVDDCGRLIDPARARGQIQGGVVQGAAQALSEEVVFDALGVPLGAGLLDHGILSACEVPDLISAQLETPAPGHPLGTKGVGESGTTGATPALLGAIQDALGGSGSELQMPAHAERVWRVARASERD